MDLSHGGGGGERFVSDNILKVPRAFNGRGQLVAPEFARKDQRYLCPNCRTLLFLRRGVKVRPHFAHTPTKTCTGESILHEIAKNIVCDRIMEWKEGKANAPRVTRKCSNLYCKSTITKELPEHITSAELECRIGSYIVDVALKAQERIVAGIEILVTHETTQEKFDNIEVPIGEVLGYEVLNDSDTFLIRKHSRPWFCKRCTYENVQIEKQLEKQSKEVWDRITYAAHVTGQSIQGAPYSTHVIPCWACGRDTLVYKWENKEMWQTEPPPDPLPRTIHFRKTKKSAGSYWMNTCGNCNAPIGDFFLSSAIARSEEPLVIVFRDSSQEEK